MSDSDPREPRPLRRRGLGRGLDALLASVESDEPGAGPILVNLDPNTISPNPEQPRRHFAEDTLASLAESIRIHGLLHPIVVERSGSGYQLVAGERRLRAAQRAGVTTIPAIIRPAAESARHSLELALTENLNRDDLDPIEEAAAFARLADTFGLSHDAIALRIGRARPTVTNAIRLLTLSAPVQEAVSAGRLSPGHARALVVLPSHRDQEELASEIEATGMSVRVIESLVQDRLTRAPSGPESPGASRPHGSALSPDDEAVRRGMERALGAPVALRRRRRGGDVIVTFASDEDLGAIYRRVGGPPL